MPKEALLSSGTDAVIRKINTFLETPFYIGLIMLLTLLSIPAGKCTTTLAQCWPAAVLWDFLPT